MSEFHIKNYVSFACDSNTISHTYPVLHLS